MIGRWAPLLAVLWSGCATGGSLEKLGLDELRAQATAFPADPDLQRAVALAEMFSYQGDASRVQAQLDKALELDSDNPRLQLVAGVYADAHGLPPQALDHYLSALGSAEGSDDPFANQIAEIAALAVAGVEGGAPGYNDRVRPVFEELLSRRRLALPARHALGNLLMSLAFRRGDRAAAQTIASRLGCITEWRMAGPFGPRALGGFDRKHAVVPGQPMAESYDLGPARGTRAVRELGARGCSVNLGGGALAVSGTSYAQTHVRVAETGPYLLRIETPNSFEVFVDGRSMMRLDRRRLFRPRSVYLPLDLEAGDHVLTLKLTTRHPNPAMSIALNPLGPADLAATRLPFRGDTKSGFARYLRASSALVRGDVVGAREVLSGVERARHAAPMLWLQRAFLALNDPLVPDDVRNDQARGMLLAALRQDPKLWNPTVQVASMAANHGRVTEAIDALRKARQLWPDVPAIGLTLIELLRAKGWNAEADRVVHDLRRMVPDACVPMQEELSMLRSRGREEAAWPVVDKIMGCDAQANARYAMLLRKRDWEGASAELARLASLDPPQGRFGWLLAELELAKNRGDEVLVERILGQLRASYPRSTTGTLEHVDRLLAAGRRESARDALIQTLDAEPAAMASLWRLAPIVGAEHVMSPLRMDGAKAIAEYEASGRSYEGPQVLVLDYMAVRLFEDGSSIEIVHTIQKAQSDEAVDSLAEVQVPDNARVLKLQTIKPDGRRLEADAIGGKETISLPSMAVGDYVEFEYIAHNDPSEGFPRGYLGDRFYFRSFEIPFDFSHLVVALPKDMPFAIDPRGAAPAVEEKVEGDLRTLSWTVTRSEPLVAEPGAVAGREYIPSVRLGVRATWDAFVESIWDVLVDRSMHDPEISRLVESIVGEADPDDYRLRARRIHRWVSSNIENTNDMFSQAALMIRAKAGNRARILDYMLELAGVPSTLALVRSKAADATASEMADGDTFEHLVVVAGAKNDEFWIHSIERWAPFDYMPPLLQGQPALILRPGEPLRTVPAGVPDDDRHVVELDVHMGADGSATFDVVETLDGSGAIAWRSQLEATPDAELEHRFEDDYVARLVPGATLSSLEIVGREESNQPLKLAYRFDVDVLGRRVPQGWALPSLLANRLAMNYARLAERTTTQLIDAPVNNRIVFHFDFPDGTRRPPLPQEAALDGPGGAAFRLKSHWEDRTLVVERSLRMPIMRVDPQAYPGFVDFCRRVDVVEARELVLGLPD